VDELRKLATVAKLMIRGPMPRHECRGLHFDTDFPEPFEEMCRNVVLLQGRDPEMRQLGDVSFG